MKFENSKKLYKKAVEILVRIPTAFFCKPCYNIGN